MINEPEANTMNTNNILCDFDSQIMLWRQHGYQGQQLITILVDADQSGIMELQQYVHQFFQIISFRTSAQSGYIFNHEECVSALGITGNHLNQILHDAGFSRRSILHFMGPQWKTYMYIQVQQIDETSSDEEIEDGGQEWQSS